MELRDAGKLYLDCSSDTTLEESGSWLRIVGTPTEVGSSSGASTVLRTAIELDEIPWFVRCSTRHRVAVSES
jgi:hypothetical protein